MWWTRSAFTSNFGGQYLLVYSNVDWNAIKANKCTSVRPIIQISMGRPAT